MPIHPTEENFVEWQFEEVLNGLALSEQFTETWMGIQVQILEHEES